MAIKNDLIGLGMPAPLASLVGENVATALTAAGSALASALQLTESFNFIGTAAASTGVRLPTDTPVGGMVIIRNGGANSVTIYPPTSAGVINALSAGAGIACAATKTCIAVRTGAGQWFTGFLQAS